VEIKDEEDEEIKDDGAVGGVDAAGTGVSCDATGAHAYAVDEFTSSEDTHDGLSCGSASFHPTLAHGHVPSDDDADSDGGDSQRSGGSSVDASSPSIHAAGPLPHELDAAVADEFTQDDNNNEVANDNDAVDSGPLASIVDDDAVSAKNEDHKVIVASTDDVEDDIKDDIKADDELDARSDTEDEQDVTTDDPGKAQNSGNQTEIVESSEITEDFGDDAVSATSIDTSGALIKPINTEDQEETDVSLDDVSTSDGSLTITHRQQSTGNQYTIVEESHATEIFGDDDSSVATVGIETDVLLRSDQDKDTTNNKGSSTSVLETSGAIAITTIDSSVDDIGPSKDVKLSEKDDSDVTTRIIESSADSTDPISDAAPLVFSAIENNDLDESESKEIDPLGGNSEVSNAGGFVDLKQTIEHEEHAKEKTEKDDEESQLLVGIGAYKKETTDADNAEASCVEADDDSVTKLNKDDKESQLLVGTGAYKKETTDTGKAEASAVDTDVDSVTKLNKDDKDSQLLVGIGAYKKETTDADNAEASGVEADDDSVIKLNKDEDDSNRGDGTLSGATVSVMGITSITSVEISTSEVVTDSSVGSVDPSASGVFVTEASETLDTDDVESGSASLAVTEGGTIKLPG